MRASLVSVQCFLRLEEGSNRGVYLGELQLPVVNKATLVHEVIYNRPQYNRSHEMASVCMCSIPLH